jgi:hypothetical protein
VASYGILRIEKIKLSAGGQLSGRAKHNCREYENSNRPKNIDPDRTRLNQTFGAKSVAEVKERAKTLWDKAKSKRSDAVGMLEVMITLSSKNTLSTDEIDRYLKRSKTFIEGLYGEENVIGVFFHYDEKVPHLHAFVVPLEKKMVLKKQKASEKKLGIQRQEERYVLNAKKITASRQCLRELQNRFHKQVSVVFGLERGEPSEETHARNRRPSIRAEERQLKMDKEDFETAMRKHPEDLFFADLPKEKLLETAKAYRERVRPEFMGKIKGLEEYSHSLPDVIKKEVETLIKKDLESLDDFQKENIKIKEQNRSLKAELETLNKNFNHNVSLQVDREKQKMEWNIKNEKETSIKTITKLNESLEWWRKKTPETLRKLADEYESYGAKDYQDFYKKYDEYQQRQQQRGRGRDGYGWGD